ncbi:MAG TPA: hypothetical protein VKX96_08530 [Chloroflexota bacterium]|nr:hypothetical protein [Chloroflexota bacterium]
MSLEDEIDLLSLAQRAVASMRVSTEFEEDLFQQAVVTAIELLRCFQPRTGADQPEPRVQAERYVFVSLRWHLRAYLRRLRSLLPVPDHDRRLARAYNELAAKQGSLPVVDAAKRLGVKANRLAAALAARDSVASLDSPVRPADDSDNEGNLVQQLAAAEPSTEELALARIEAEIRTQHQTILAKVIQEETTRSIASGPVSRSTMHRSTRQRGESAYHLLQLLLDQLSHGEAEIIRLAFALRRKELGALRSCRAYGCRYDRGHRHSPAEIARWVGTDEASLTRRLGNTIDDLKDFLGGRDVARLLGELSDGSHSRSRASSFVGKSVGKSTSRSAVRLPVSRTRSFEPELDGISAG